jgi:broad specificity phosphatase PhoE
MAYPSDMARINPFRRAVSAVEAKVAEPLFDTEGGTFEDLNAPIAMARVNSRSYLGDLLEDKRTRFSSKGELIDSPASSPKKQADDVEVMGSIEAKAREGLSVFLGSRCTRVHFVRHAEGFHNVVTHKAAASPEVLAAVAKCKEEALQQALAQGHAQDKAAEMAKEAATAEMRTLENEPVHWNTPGGEQYTDAELTEYGRNQCYALRGKIDRNSILDPTKKLHIDLVVSSPLRRCMETADIIFGPGRDPANPNDKLTPFLVHDLCRERYGEFFCDKRLPHSQTMEDPRYAHFDWDTQKESLNADATLPWADEDEAWENEREPQEHTIRRAIKFLRWLSSRPEKEIAVVTHSSFLKCMFKVFGGESCKQDQDVLRAVPANCELRTVVLCHHGQ